MLVLMREPVLQDKRAEHVKFQRLGLELIQAVSGHSKTEAGTSADVSIQSIHRVSDCVYLCCLSVMMKYDGNFDVVSET